MLRDLMLDKIQRLKDKENKFKNQKWNDFFVGAFHISEFNPSGMQDEMLFDFYNEVFKWHYTNLALNKHDVSNRRELLIAFMESLTKEDLTQIEIAEFENVANKFLGN